MIAALFGFFQQHKGVCAGAANAVQGGGEGLTEPAEPGAQAHQQVLEGHTRDFEARKHLLGLFVEGVCGDEAVEVGVDGGGFEDERVQVVHELVQKRSQSFREGALPGEGLELGFEAGFQQAGLGLAPLHIGL